MGERDDELLAVLREIRDLQKAHYERYFETTSRMLEQQRKSLRQADDDTAAALDEQRRIGRWVRLSLVLFPVLGVALIAAIAVAVWVALSRSS